MEEMALSANQLQHLTNIQSLIQSGNEHTLSEADKGMYEQYRAALAGQFGGGPGGKWLPDRIEDMTSEQRNFLDNLVDQVDAEYPTDRMDEERLAKDPHLAILPSGMKVSTRGIRSFEILDEEEWRNTPVGFLPPTAKPGDAMIRYEHGGEEWLSDPHDIAAFNAALNEIGVYVEAPTLKGDDNDGDGQTAEGAPV